MFTRRLGVQARRWIAMPRGERFTTANAREARSALDGSLELSLAGIRILAAEIGHALAQLAGSSTVLTTWMTPLDWLTSGMVTRDWSPLASTM